MPANFAVDRRPPAPPAAREDGIGAYRFEAPVRCNLPYGAPAHNFIDLYRRDCFILEAKQSNKTDRKQARAQAERHPFPFPDASPEQRAAIRDLGKQLDAFRKARLAAHSHLTMTRLYNVLERVRGLEAGEGEPLTAAEQDIYNAGLIGTLQSLHDDLDAAVADATAGRWGWRRRC